MSLELVVHINEKAHLDWGLCTCYLVCCLDFGFGNLDQKYQLGVLLANLFTFIDLRCET